MKEVRFFIFIQAIVCIVADCFKLPNFVVTVGLDNPQCYIPVSERAIQLEFAFLYNMQTLQLLHVLLTLHSSLLIRIIFV